jgi:hypothetical protein
MTAPFTINCQTGTYTFLTARTVGGGFFRSDAPVVVEEELTTPGVDGRRWRTQSRQFPTITVETVSGCTNFAEAVDKSTAYGKLVGTLVDISITADGVPFVFNKVHVASVVGEPRRGDVSGADAGTPATAYVYSTWTFVETEFATSTNQ